MRQIRVRPTSRIAVVGAGKLGMLISKVLSAAGGDVHVLCRTEKTCELPRSWGLPTKMTKDIEHDSFDFVVEATGNTQGAPSLTHAL